jgi:hypothetical protein
MYQRAQQAFTHTNGMLLLNATWQSRLRAAAE